LIYEAEFNDILLRAIDEALLALGEGPRAAIYCSLESNCNLKRGDIPSRISDFSDALDKIFGLAARNLEIIFMKHLHNRIEALDIGAVVPVPADLTFQKYVCTLRESFDEVMNRRNMGLEFLINEGEKKKQIQ
jgi:hypothetical protein